MIALTPRARNMIGFLRMVAIEMRRLAERAPELAIELRHVARQCDAEADELEGQPGR